MSYYYTPVLESQPAVICDLEFVRACKVNPLEKSGSCECTGVASSVGFLVVKEKRVGIIKKKASYIWS